MSTSSAAEEGDSVSTPDAAVGPAVAPESATAAAAAEARSRRTDRILEIVTVVILSVTTLATSWSGYQAGRWGGVQSTLYSQASAKRVESTRAETAAVQDRLADLILFTDWLQAFTTDNMELATFYQERFRAEFKPAFDAWVATTPRTNPDALPSPFAQPEYVLSNAQEALRLEEEASATFVEGQAANQQSDDYVLNTVLLASVLFFAAISQRFTILPIRITMLVMATIMCLIGISNIATYPIY